MMETTSKIIAGHRPCREDEVNRSTCPDAKLVPPE